MFPIEEAKLHEAPRFRERVESTDEGEHLYREAMRGFLRKVASLCRSYEYCTLSMPELIDKEARRDIERKEIARSMKRMSKPEDLFVNAFRTGKDGSRMTQSLIARFPVAWSTVRQQWERGDLD